MDNKDKLTPLERAVRICVVLYAIALVAVLYAIFRTQEHFVRIAIVSVAITVFMIATIFLGSMLFVRYHETHKRNIFLYDKKKKGNISTDELSFSCVRERVIDYMALFKRGKKLYVGELFRDAPWTIEAMKPLLCYELLYELSEEKSVESCRMFLGYGSECAGIFSKYLMENSDYELCERINEFFGKYRGEPEIAKEFSAYISGKKHHIEEKMLEYTKKNVDRFVI